MNYQVVNISKIYKLPITALAMCTKYMLIGYNDGKTYNFKNNIIINKANSPVKT